jgi:glycerophosphoryl diester phosphodiesterase
MPYSRSLFKFKIAIGVLTETNLDLLAFAKFIQAKSIHPYFHHRRKYGQNAGRGFLFPWTVNEIEDKKKNV